MNLKIVGTAFALLFTLSANAKILSVTRDLTNPKSQALFIVEIETCRASFPTVNPTTTKLTNDSALLSLNVFSGCRAGHQPDNRSRFLLDADFELKKLGLDPATSKIYIQLQ